MIKAIIFDWHGVLDNTKLEDLFKKTAELSSIPIIVLKNNLKNYTRDYALGIISSKIFWNRFVEFTALPNESITSLRNYINAIELNTELWNLLPELKKKYSLVILSDCPKEKVETIRNLLNLKLFNYTFFSAETHMDKNTESFFMLVTDSLKLKPKDCLFIDDSKNKVSLANKMGFSTYLFKNTYEFEKYIKTIDTNTNH